MEIKTRYKQLVERIKAEVKRGSATLTNSDIAKELGYTREYFQSLLGSKGKIGENHLTDLLLRFPEVSDNITAEPITQETRPFHEKRRETKLNNDDPYLVPFVDIPAQAGYSKAYQQRDYIATLRKYPILPDVDPAGAIWRYFQVEGDSMEPEIMAGDTILCSQVNREDWNEIKNHHTHVVVTDENLWIKDVYRESESEWILLSQNPDSPPFVVKVEDIRQCWVMRRHIKGRAKKHRMYDMKEVRKQLNLNKRMGSNQEYFQSRSGVNPSPFEDMRKQT